MSFQRTLNGILANDPTAIYKPASSLADMIEAQVGARPSVNTINQYKWTYKKEHGQHPILSQESIMAGKRNANNEAKRKWQIEEAVKVLKRESVSLEEVFANWA